MGNTVQVKEFGDALTEGRSDIAAQLDADLQLDPCAKLERQDFGGDTPLHLAARSGLDGMVATWLACPRDVAGASARTVACLNAKKRTVLHAACATTRERDDAAASAETERRWQLDFENANGVILAREMVAIRARGATGATFTGDEGSDDAAGEWGELVAIENDTRDATLRTVTIILKHSSCEEKVLNLIDKEGNTALHLAARSGLPRCIAALLSAGARLDIVSTIGRSPADEAHVAKLLTISGQLEARVVLPQRTICLLVSHRRRLRTPATWHRASSSRKYGARKTAKSSKRARFSPVASPMRRRFSELLTGSDEN
jgi:hypothetical protein